MASLSQGVQDFYNGPCAVVDFIDLTHEEEITELLYALVEFHKGDSTKE